MDPREPLADPRRTTRKRYNPNVDDDDDVEVIQVVPMNMNMNMTREAGPNQEVLRNLNNTNSSTSFRETRDTRDSQLDMPSYRDDCRSSSSNGMSNRNQFLEKNNPVSRETGGGSGRYTDGNCNQNNNNYSNQGSYWVRGDRDTTNRGPSRYDQMRLRQKFDKFLSEKRGLVYRPLAPDEIPTLESRLDEQQNEGCYGVAPTLDMCLGLDVTERQREFYKNASCGDVVLTEVTKTYPHGRSGMNLLLLCFEGRKHGFLEDLDIVVTCYKSDMIPPDPFDLSKDYQLGDKIRCEIIKLNSTTREVLLGMRGMYSTNDLTKAFPLGIVLEEDMPEHYRLDRAVWQSGKKPNYNQIMTSSSGFNNPNSISFLGSLLGIYSNHNSLTLGLSHPFPRSTLASSLRSVQNAKLAQDNLDQGLYYFQSGDNAKALDSFNKTIIVDPQNVRALVSRALIHVQNQNLPESARDVETVLKRDLEDDDVKRDVAHCLVSIGKMYHEASEEEKALQAYDNCLNIVPEHPQTLKLLMGLHSQVSLLTSNQGLLSGKIGDLKEKLDVLIQEEIFKERRSGTYKKFLPAEEELEYSRPPRPENPWVEKPSTSTGLTLSRQNSAEIRRPLSPLSQIREAAYETSKSRRGSSSDRSATRRKKKSKRRKSRRRSSSSSSVNSSAETERSGLENCDTITDQVDAFLAKCDLNFVRVTAPLPPESLRVTIAQNVNEPQVRFVAQGSSESSSQDSTRRIELISPSPSTSSSSPIKPKKGLPEKFNLQSDKYGNVKLTAAESRIVQTVTRTQVSMAKFEMTINSPKPASTLAQIPTVFSSPSASSDDCSFKTVPKIPPAMSKWKPVVGPAVTPVTAVTEEMTAPEPELQVTFKNTPLTEQEIHDRIAAAKAKIHTALDIQGEGVEVPRNSSSSWKPRRSRSPPSKRGKDYSKTEAGSQSTSRSSSVSKARSRSRSGSRSTVRTPLSAMSTESSKSGSGSNSKSRESNFRPIRSRSRSKTSANFKSRRSNSRSRPRSTFRSKSRPNFRSKSRSNFRRSKSRSKSRSNFRSKSRPNYRSKSRSSNSGSKSRSRSRSLSRHRSRSGSLSKRSSRSRSGSRSKSRPNFARFNKSRDYGQGIGRSRGKSHGGSPRSMSPSPGPPVPQDYYEPPRRIPRRRWDPNYISPNYRGYHPVPAYKFDPTLARKGGHRARINNASEYDQSSFNNRIPARVPRSRSPQAPASPDD